MTALLVGVGKWLLLIAGGLAGATCSRFFYEQFGFGQFRRRNKKPRRR